MVELLIQMKKNMEQNLQVLEHLIIYYGNKTND